MARGLSALALACLHATPRWAAAEAAAAPARCRGILEGFQGKSDFELALLCRAQFPESVCRGARRTLGARPWDPEGVSAACEDWMASSPADQVERILKAAAGDLDAAAQDKEPLDNTTTTKTVTTTHAPTFPPLPTFPALPTFPPPLAAVLAPPKPPQRAAGTEDAAQARAAEEERRPGRLAEKFEVRAAATAGVAGGRAGAWAASALAGAAMLVSGALLARRLRAGGAAAGPLANREGDPQALAIE